MIFFFRFGQACTFAHGFRELRAVLRHPRYKTDLCRTYHGAGYCQYGARCHFIHDPEEDGVHAMNGYKPHPQLDRLGRTVPTMSGKPVDVERLIIRNLQQFHAYKAAEERLSFSNSSHNSNEQLSPFGYGNEQLSSIGCGNEQLNSNWYDNEQLSSIGYGNEQVNSIGELSPDILSLNMLTIGQNGPSGLASESYVLDNFIETSDLSDSFSMNYMDMKAPVKEGTEVEMCRLPCSGKKFDANSKLPPTLSSLAYLDTVHTSGDIWRLGEASTHNKAVIGNPMEMSRSLQIPSISELIHMP